MITTHNRLSELQRTLGVIENMSPGPDEILITADGCTDETAEWVQANAPDAMLTVNQPGQGSIPSRDRMIRQSTCDLILSLDDDSYPIEKDAIELLKNWFADHQDVGVLAFPLVSEEFPESLQAKYFDSEGLSATFANCAACFDRQIYLRLEGFPHFFFHAYEEPDYGLQCIRSNYAIVHDNVITVRHHFTPIERNEIRTHHRHARNEMWSTLMRAPLFVLPAIVPYRIFSQFRYAIKRGLDWVIREPNWWWQAGKGVLQCMRSRKPVPWNRYKLWLSLLRRTEPDHQNWRRIMETGSRD